MWAPQVATGISISVVNAGREPSQELPFRWPLASPVGSQMFPGLILELELEISLIELRT
jgi:hypothetical protein